MENQTINITEIILNAINEIFSKLFSSIDNTIYTLLDDITFITPDILENNNFRKIIGETNYSGILLICNSLVFGFIILPLEVTQTEPEFISTTAETLFSKAISIT